MHPLLPLLTLFTRLNADYSEVYRPSSILLFESEMQWRVWEIDRERSTDREGDVSVERNLFPEVKIISDPGGLFRNTEKIKIRLLRYKIDVKRWRKYARSDKI